MSNLELIGKVAATRIEQEFHGDDGSPPSRLLYGIIDLSAPVACAVAKQIAEIKAPEGRTEVFIHPRIAAASSVDIGKATLSEETATYHRGNTAADVALTVFSVPAEDTAAVRQSLAHVSVINSDWLTDDMRRWASCAMPGANETLRDQLTNVLIGLRRSGIVSEITMYSDFLAEVERYRTGTEGLPIGDAVRRALPALRLPKNSGDMRATIDQSPEKAEVFFRKIYEDVRPALYLRGKDGESLNVVELRGRLKRFETEGEIVKASATAILALLDNPAVGGSTWLPEQAAVAAISWEQTELLFSDTKKKAPATFGEETLLFFEQNHPGVLTKDQKDLLNNLRRDSANASDVHGQFFLENSTRLADNPQLYRRWEKLLYKKPVEASDLQAGLIRLVHQTMQNVGEDHLASPAIFVRLRRSATLPFWTQEKNTRLCRYLRDRYRGLEQILAPDVVLDFGLCWTDSWDTDSIQENAAESKGATTFEFEAFYVDRTTLAAERAKAVNEWEGHLRNRPKAQLVWSPSPNAMGLAFSDDILALSETGATAKEGTVPLLTSTVSANRYDKHGSLQTIDLNNQASVKDALFDSNGHLANDRVPENRIDLAWAKSLQSLITEGIVTSQQGGDVLKAFEDFRGAYGRAVRAFRSGKGLADPVVIEQASLFGEVLAVLKLNMLAPLAIRELWLPLLRIGVAQVTADRPTALVSGWSPLRLAEIAVKARQLSSATSDIIQKYSKHSSEIEAFIKDTVRNLSATYYQDIALSAGSRPELLVETVRSLEVSLMESPRPGDSVIADEPANDIADNFDIVAQDYLKLRPHEKANFATMLLNSESENLPVQIANHMAQLMERETSLRCDLVLTHEDAGQLRRIYEQQNRKIGYEVDSALTSEAARTFLSRLRVGIVSPDRLDSSLYGKSHDIVILHGVVSRKADVRWSAVAKTDPMRGFENHVPVAYSKKKPFHKGDTASGTYLTSPDRIAPTEAYLDAVHACLTGNAVSDIHWIPLQEVEFQSGSVKELMRRAHGLAEWVMTYDRIADRRLLANDERRILRYYSSPRSDHNVIISTEINAQKLGERLEGDLLKAIPDADREQREKVIRAIHRQSASLSGAIVMRGAERVNHAHELLGLVLARRDIEGLLRVDAHADLQKTAWFFIDDYLQWLEIGQPRADILAVNFAVVDGKKLLRIAVGEAKFVSLAGVNEQKRHSLEQLASTVAQLTKRLVSPDGTMNPLGWRSRIADLVLEHIDPFDHIDGIPFEEWIDGLRHGTLPVTVSGHSLVYVHDMDEDPKREPMVPDGELHPKEVRRFLAQWTFGRPSIASGLMQMAEDDVPSRIFSPTEWPSNPYKASSDVLPPTEVKLSNVVEQIEDFARTTHELTPDDIKQASAPVQSQSPTATVQIEAEATAQEATPTVEPSPHSEARSETEETVPPGWLPTVWRSLGAMKKQEQIGAGEAWLEAQAAALRNALQSEGHAAIILGKRLTPNSAIITLDGTKSLGVAWLEKNATDLRTRHGIEISRVTPLTMKIAVTIDRKPRAVLHLSEAWGKRALDSNAPETNSASVIGDKELDGELLYLPLFDRFGDLPRAAPHTLISGTTGSGKGILATNLMLDLCAFNSPENLRLYLIDPKSGVDYVWLRKLPHLEGEIVSDVDEAVALFKGLVIEMENRYKLFAEYGVNGIAAYQKLKGKTKPMPRIVLFFDEVSNFMQDENFQDNVTAEINKLATKSRAAGIHIVMIYQRADVQVMSMQLRANLGNKLILRLGDEGSSKIALGEKGAEKLLGGGHIIAKIDSDEKFYAQVPYLDPETEVFTLADAIRDGWRAAKVEI